MSLRNRQSNRVCHHTSDSTLRNAWCYLMASSSLFISSFVGSKLFCVRLAAFFKVSTSTDAILKVDIVSSSQVFQALRLWADGEREGRRREGDHITQADCPEFLKTLFFMRSHLTTANKQWYIFKKLCSSVRLPRLVFRVQWRRQFCQARCPHHHYRLPTSNLILRLGEYNSTKNLLSWFCLLVTSMHVKAKKFGCKRSS